MKFKKGDKVIINENGLHFEGVIYTAFQTYADVLTDKSGVCSFLYRYIELAKSLKLHVGDTATGIEDDNPYTGQVVAVGANYVIIQVPSTLRITFAPDKVTLVKRAQHSTFDKTTTVQTELIKGVRVERINMRLYDVKEGTKGTVTGVTKSYDAERLIYEVLWDSGQKYGTRAENLKILEEAVGYYTPAQQPYQINKILQLKENTMSTKVITTHKVETSKGFFYTKDLTVDQTAELIRGQTANINALTALPIKTTKIEAQIAELQVDLSAFIEHMNELP